MLRRIICFICICAIFSCNSASETEAEIEKEAVDFEVIRFDKKFAQTTEAGLPELKQQFPFLFPSRFSDSLWVSKLSDTIQLEINKEVEKAFPEFSEETDELHSLFQHVKFYFPAFKVPDVITLTSEVDYKNKTIYTGEYLFISLDTYLGQDHPFYIGIQEFLKKNFNKEQITVDAAAEIAKEYVPQPNSRTFIAHALHYGKILYLKDLFLPFKSDAQKIGYTNKELEWAKANEAQAWRYFVENELIFDTDSQLYSRFLYPAPFSKFYLELDSESPAMIGQFIGWQIIRQYMAKNDVSVESMLKTNAEELFNNSKYKPSK